MTNDTYLNSISTESLEVLKHFGPEAPVKLNTYACRLEDTLLKALEHQKTLQQQVQQYRDHVDKVEHLLQAAKDEREEMMAILTDPKQLIEYVRRFFGPEGPCPGGAVISRCTSESPVS